jgi:folylpolyglutamate synthase/dihydropteroate synthase
MAGLLFPVAQRIIATKVENPRAAGPEEIAEAGAHTGADILLISNLGEALKCARSVTQPGGVIVVTGSAYLVGEALGLLRNPVRNQVRSQVRNPGQGIAR